MGYWSGYYVVYNSIEVVYSSIEMSANFVSCKRLNSSR